MRMSIWLVLLLGCVCMFKKIVLITIISPTFTIIKPCRTQHTLFVFSRSNSTDLLLNSSNKRFNNVVKWIYVKFNFQFSNGVGLVLLKSLIKKSSITKLLKETKLKKIIKVQFNIDPFKNNNNNNNKKLIYISIRFPSFYVKKSIFVPSRFGLN